MIQTLKIKNIATFSDEEQILDKLSSFNYIYGANASGKTTISRAIDNNRSDEKISIKWSNSQPLSTFVYNSDFVEKNFNQSGDIKGIFTLGEQDAETVNQIQKLKQEQSKLVEKIGKLTRTLEGEEESQEDGKRKELQNLISNFTDKCWAQKIKHDNDFQDAFQGFRGRKEVFYSKLIQEHSNNNSTVQTLEYLKERANILFGKRPTEYSPVDILKDSEINSLERSPILKKKIIGTADIDLSSMIKNLGISDWVKEGKSYLEENNGEICPFCQQKTEATLTEQLNTFFDESYEKDITTLEKVKNSYELKCSTIYQGVSPPPLLDTEKLNTTNELFKSKADSNIAKLKEKKAEPSRSIVLESTQNILSMIYEIIEDTNEKITNHNKTVSNFSSENSTLKKEVWKYIIDIELNLDIEQFTQKKSNIEEAIQGLENQVSRTKQEHSELTKKLTVLEKNVTSIRPTITEINSILNGYGFNGFKFEESSEKLHYKIVRSDGSSVGNSLSEGEKTFITFLYFHHLLNGSNNEKEGEITSDRVVVFDDPISSLDSNILFIVTSLIRQTIEKVRKNEGSVKQVFVLTHNIYFHKEVTFNNRRGGTSINEESFWIVRKVNDISNIEFHSTNPIKTSYELLWRQVKSDEKCTLTIQNVLRRILDNYFKIMGNIRLNELHDSFSGKEQFFCKSLLSWEEYFVCFLVRLNGLAQLFFLLILQYLNRLCF